VEPQILSYIKHKEIGEFSNGKYEWTITLKERRWTSYVRNIFYKYEVDVRPYQLAGKRKQVNLKIKQQLTKEELITHGLWILINQLS